MYDIQTVRADFPVLNRKVNNKPLVYLDNAATSQKPKQVIDSVSNYYCFHNSNVHRGVHTLSVEATDLYEEARQKVGSFINSKKPEQVIWVRNTTEAINLVAKTWGEANINNGDEIVVSEMEHHSNLVPWQQLAEKKGAKLKLVGLDSDYKLDLEQLHSEISNRTRLVAITHMSNVLGTITPIKEIATAAHNVGAKILVDAAQSVPHLNVDVQDLECDFLAFSGHKMLAPTGIGCLYVTEEILSLMDPFMHGGEMVLEVSFEKASWADLPMRFEAGTPNIAGAIAMGSAVDYLKSTGVEAIHAHETSLMKHALGLFDDLEEVTCFGTKDLESRGGVISFAVNGVHPHDLGQVLDSQGVAIRTGHHCAMPLVRSRLNVPATARASFYLYNTLYEVEALISAVDSALSYFGRSSRNN
ncbi:MAG: cysteine desulfurase [Chloroflexi bacterium]|nr:cysteine desulfurase [Chloroflexota bacterium]